MATTEYCKGCRRTSRFTVSEFNWGETFQHATCDECRAKSSTEKAEIPEFVLSRPTTYREDHRDSHIAQMEQKVKDLSRELIDAKKQITVPRRVTWGNVLFLVFSVLCLLATLYINWRM